MVPSPVCRCARRCPNNSIGAHIWGSSITLTGYRKIWRTFVIALVAIFAGVAIAISNIGYWINSNVEARLLLKGRGALPTPPQVVIFSIDNLDILQLRQSLAEKIPSAAWLHACLSTKDLETVRSARYFSDVPRGLYRCLLERISAHSPTAVIFDVNFAEARPEDDRFATVIREAGNVFLFVAIDALNDDSGLVIVKRPAPTLSGAAAGVGHFRVGGAGLTRTFLPAAYLGIDALPAILARRAKPMPPLEADPLYFDFFGANGAVRTVSIADYLLGRVSEPLNTGEVIFIGHSDADSIEKIDHFRTPADVFGAEYLSGVELMATAYVNLRDGRQKTYLGLAEVIILSIGIALAMTLIIALRQRRRPAAYSALIGASALTTWGLYDIGYFAPVLTLLIVIVAISELWRIASSNMRLRAAVRTLLPKFAREPFVEHGALPPDGTRATVAFCDLVGSTSIAEVVGPERFAELMQDYYRLATDCFEKEGGDMVDFLGDGFIAIFKETDAGPSTSSRAFTAFETFAAVLATLKVYRSDLKLRSRIGVCTGSVRAGAFGGDRRVKVTAMGDAMNTAARLEENAKPIFASLEDKPIILVAADKASVDAQSFPTFPLVEFGPIKLRGKSVETMVYTIAFY